MEKAHCIKGGIFREDESCRFNDNCIYPQCMAKTERMQQLKIALGINDIYVDDKTSDIIVRTMDAINKKHGELTINEMIQIRGDVEFAHAQYALHVQSVGQED